jgi:hypothetical protein
VSVAEAATIPRGLWLDLARISEAADLGGMDQNMDTTHKQKQPYYTSWSIVLALQWGMMAGSTTIIMMTL